MGWRLRAEWDDCSCCSWWCHSADQVAEKYRSLTATGHVRVWIEDSAGEPVDPAEFGLWEPGRLH